MRRRLMRWWLLPVLLLVVPQHPLLGPERAAAQLTAAEATPPVAARKPVRLTAHGIERVDDYAWIRDANWREVMADQSRLAPEIRAHVEAENRYSEAALAPLSALRVRLIEEMKGRIEQAETGVPTPDGAYAYWRKFVPGAEHPQLVRGRRDGSAEEVLLDGAAMATGKAYFNFGSTEHSKDHRYFAYLVDETGSESYTLRIRDVGARKDLPETMAEVADLTWAPDSATLFYVRLDSDHRARFVYRHRLGTDPAADQLVFEEKDLGFEVSIYGTRSGRFVMISTGSSDTSETWLIDGAKPESAPAVVVPRAPGLRYFVDDWGDRLVIRTNADGAGDFKVVTAPASAPGRSNWRDLVPYKEGRQIVSVVAFAGHLASVEREDGLPRLVIYRKSDLAAHVVAVNEEAYALELGNGYEFDTSTVRYLYSSPAQPQQTIDYDMESRERVLRKQQRIPSGHDSSAYVVRRLFATTADNEQVPVTVLHRKGLQLDGSAPLFLEGYGAYAYVFATPFNSNMLSLVDRGFVYAIAHIRGGLDKGQRWYEAGRRENKVNTFKDFITVAEYLTKASYSRPGRIVARGDSAGGLLMGAVANMRPDLFAGIIARVPFVDVVNTMLDDTLPLTVSDFPEWGDPSADIETYRRLAGYSPYDNVAAKAYPHMLVTGGIADPRVQYWEPAKWVAKLRAMKTNDARITLIMRMSAGHFGAAGRFEWLEELGLIQAFALDVTGLAAGDARPVSQALGSSAPAAPLSTVVTPSSAGGPRRQQNLP
ncbi:MAG: oligopeptidase [Alphaproteobacteria bacterium]|nr:oligopeptidase [Alphaproteobacteria bacterium]